MPSYGEVWRQTTRPILWVHGIHDVNLLKVRDLRPNSGLPLLTRYFSDEERLAVKEAEGETDFPHEQLNILFDSSDEESSDENNEDGEDVDEQETGDEDGWGDGGFGDQADEDAANRFLENEREGDEIKERIDLFEHRIQAFLNTLKDLKKYPSSHPHLREIPDLDARNMVTLLDWSERRQLVQNARTFPTTFGANRRGNVFM